MAAGIKFSRPSFAYRYDKTILHRAPAGLKFLCVIVFSALGFVSIPALVVSILLVLAAAAIAHIPPWELLKGSRPLAMISVFIVLVKTLRPWMPEIVSIEGLCDALVSVLRIFVPYAAAALLFAVTTMRELRQSLAAVELTLKNIFVSRNKKGIAFVSLGLCLMLGFIPRFFDLWEASNLACEARSCKRGLHRLFILLPLVTERIMETAADSALALQSRGVGVEE